MATFGSFFYRQTNMKDCSKAAALASFFYWTQTDPIATDLAETYAAHAPPPTTRHTSH
jgi:hypothetical protein